MATGKRKVDRDAEDHVCKKKTAAKRLYLTWSIIKLCSSYNLCNPQPGYGAMGNANNLYEQCGEKDISDIEQMVNVLYDPDDVMAPSEHPKGDHLCIHCGDCVGTLYKEWSKVNVGSKTVPICHECEKKLHDINSEMGSYLRIMIQSCRKTGTYELCSRKNNHGGTSTFWKHISMDDLTKCV